VKRQRHGAGIELDGLIERDDEASDARALGTGQAGEAFFSQQAIPHSDGYIR
jgi:hypothetical protein